MWRCGRHIRFNGYTSTAKLNPLRTVSSKSVRCNRISVASDTFRFRNGQGGPPKPITWFGPFLTKSITKFLYIRCTFLSKTEQFLYIPGMYKNTFPVHFVHISCTMYKNIIKNKLFSVQCTSFSVHFLNYFVQSIFCTTFWLYIFFVHKKMYRNHFWGPRKIQKEGAPQT